VTPERRAIQQVALSTPELEQAFTEGEAAGTPVSQLVAAAGVTPTDLGLRAQSEVTDASLATAAFALTGTDDVAIISGIGGAKRAIYVSEIQPAHQETLDEAREEIVRKLSTEVARGEIADMLDQIEELRAAFRPLSEIAERFNLKVATVAVTAGGAELAETEVPADARTTVATAIFRAEQGALTPAVSLGSNRNVWFDLKSVEAARDQTLDEVRDQLIETWTAQKTSEALTTEVAITLDKIRAGMSLVDAAAEINQYPVPSLPMGREGDGTPVLNPAGAEAIFAGGEGHFGAAVNGDGDQVVFQVVEITPADAGAVTPAVQQFVENSMNDGIDGDFQQGLLDMKSLRINRQALTNLLTLNSAVQ
jgi:peptidyl-prolyl cis-trans isomerase D